MHTSKEFERELTTLRERILLMGGRAEHAIGLALRALDERDRALAEQLIVADDEIDRDEVEIDELAQTILAVRQPVASDLRFIIVALKVVTDLERIGDLAANIGKRAIELNGQPPLSGSVDFAALAQLVRRNLHDALGSFVERNVERAQGVIHADREIDRMNAALFADLIARVAVEPGAVRPVIPLTSIARSLERIGDHAKNLAEQVVYMVRGRDVRHGSAVRRKPAL